MASFSDPRRLLASGALAATLALAAAAPALGHEHSAVNAHGGTGQILANGANHPGFAPGTWVSCEGVNVPANYGHAWYGLETAHHGPDSGDPGHGDGCYQADGNPRTSDDQNPGIG